VEAMLIAVTSTFGGMSTDEEPSNKLIFVIKCFPTRVSSAAAPPMLEVEQQQNNGIDLDCSEEIGPTSMFFKM